jgi:hypothetical protein
MPSKIIRKLTNDEISSLRAELHDNDDLWTTHDGSSAPERALRKSALQDGKSIHLNCTYEDLVFRYSNFATFPKTHDILKNIAENKTIARCYWHRLLPADTIDLHDDTILKFVRKNELLARYQIYLHCPPQLSDTVLVLDGVSRNPKDYEYSLIDFDLKLPHSYNNCGDEPWYFLVFDVLNAGIELK